jgi:hypothetical protein
MTVGLKPGAKGTDVRALQWALKAAGFNIAPVGVPCATATLSCSECKVPIVDLHSFKCQNWDNARSAVSNYRGTGQVIEAPTLREATLD